MKRMAEGKSHFYLGVKSPDLEKHVFAGEQAVEQFRRRAYSLRPLPAALDSNWLSKRKVILLEANRSNTFEKKLIDRNDGEVFVVKGHRSGFEMLRRKRGDVLLAYKESAKVFHLDGSVERLYWKDLENVDCHLFVSRLLPSAEKLLGKILEEYFKVKHGN